HASTTPVSYLIYFFMGAVFAFVYRKTGHLSNVIALHMLNNIVAMAVLLNAR
ncbi:MAG: CPBP family intramembrane glutamic endopeptidase, partial [Limosilactobacillus fermentum]|nr:CPBP family intramembrane glutamic endopeptidase [Limosilactobacillus fermentum]